MYRISQCGRLLVYIVQLDIDEVAAENYESDNDDKVGGFEKFVWVPGELKSGLGYPIQGSASAYKDTLVSL